LLSSRLISLQKKIDFRTPKLTAVVPTGHQKKGSNKNKEKERKKKKKKEEKKKGKKFSN